MSQTSIGEITATFRMIDQLTPALRNSEKALRDAEASFSTSGKAADKYGMSADTAAARWQAFQKNLEPVNKAVSDSKSIFDEFASGLLKGLLSGATLAALADLGAKAVGAAGDLANLARQTEIAGSHLDSLQRLGAPLGTSLDEIGRAADTMAKKLAGHDKAAAQALDSVGLSITGILKLDPATRFDTVAKAIGGIEDPALRSAAAMAIFGSSDLTPFLKALAESKGDIEGWSDFTINNLDKTSKAWGGLQSGLKDTMGRLLGDAVGFFTSWDGFVGGLVNTLPGYERFADTIKNRSNDVAGALKAVPGPARDITGPLGDAATALSDYDRANGDTEKHIRAGIKTWEDGQRAIEAYKKSVGELADTYTGKHLAQEVDKVSAAFDLAKRQGGLLAQQLPDISRQLDALRSKGAVLPSNLNDIANAFSRNAQAISRELRPVLLDLPSDIDAANIELVHMNDRFHALVVTGVEPLQHALDHGLGPAIKNLPAPPVDNWREWREAAVLHLEVVSRMGLDTIRDISEAFGRGFTDMIRGAQNFHDGLAGIWDGIKSAFFNLVDQLISYWMNTLIVRAVSSLANLLGTGAGVSIGGGVAAGSGLGAADAAIGGGGAGAAAGSGAASAAGWVAGPLIPIVIGHLINPETGWFGENSTGTGWDQLAPTDQYMAQYLSGLSAAEIANIIANGGLNVPALASGGLVNGPTLAMIGEAGPEAVVPLSQWGGMGGGTNIYIDARGSVLPDERSLRSFADMLLPKLTESASFYVSR